MLAAPLLAAALAGQAPTALVPERDCSYAESPAGRIHHDPFLIFFDWDSSAITPDAAAILDNAVRGFGPLWQRCAVGIAANADRSGSADYNLALSRRRAAAVLAYLRARGVTDGARIDSFGETRPIVETADGVREPNNRNAVILVGPPLRR